MTDFIPPSPTQKKWATYITGRRPKFKTHTNVGHAKNSLWNHPYTYTKSRGGTLYHLELDENTGEYYWAKVVDVPEWSDRAEAKSVTNEALTRKGLA